MSKTVVVNEEEFEALAEAIQDEDGWTVDIPITVTNFRF